ncbi:hypothetical protein Rhopal_000571-T1 [Rhodotorula paludigena]|uniref:DUF895 domain membrane protein n=1 Tax=Rhodotorula paludigena TaxID=86838 RepID=A0AAV5G547_9BASI|nr:hypothetical protein Rhopal_000571-T1 [Rhodotorula paludigena]
MSESKSSSLLEAAPTALTPVKRVWYRSTWWAALALGICNFCAPGIWGAMNSLGAGGQATPFLVNASNALTFGLMVVTAFLTSAMVRVIGVRWTLFFGAAGYAPYAAGLYCNNRFGNEWFLLLGTFWAIEAAVAMSYPEVYNQGKFLGWWLSFRVGGQILGGAINLGLNAQRSTAGSVDPKVYIVFIALQAAGPFTAFFLPPPSKVQRTDGQKVNLLIDNPLLVELKETAKLFFTKRLTLNALQFLLIVPLIAQAVFSESFNSTYLTLHFSVRARALGSFLSAIVCILAGNLFALLLDAKRWPLGTRARAAFALAVTLQGAWWTWSVVLNAYFHAHPTTVYDWADAGFGRAFACYLAIAAGFQMQYMFLYFVCGALVSEPADIVRIGGLLRATESAAQAVSYGLNSLHAFSTIGGASINMGLWAVALLPAWLVIRRIGVEYWGRHERDYVRDEGKGRRGSDGTVQEIEGKAEL